MEEVEFRQQLLAFNFARDTGKGGGGVRGAFHDNKAKKLINKAVFPHMKRHTTPLHSFHAHSNQTHAPILTRTTSSSFSLLTTAVS